METNIQTQIIYTIRNKKTGGYGRIFYKRPTPSMVYDYPLTYDQLKLIQETYEIVKYEVLNGEVLEFTNKEFW
jgi:hypothetical protein